MSATSGMLYIVIPVFNSWTQTRNCLRALYDSDYKDFRVIVVDHGLTDDARQELPREFPDVTRLSGDESMWWAAASNVGIDYALRHDAAFVMLLNHDCYLAPEAMGKLMRAAIDHRNMIIAPVQRDHETSGVISLAPYTMLWLGFAGCRGSVRITEIMRDRDLIDVRMIGGGRGVVVPAEVFRKVGMLDAGRLPHYYADHDFYLRCRAAGMPLKVLVSADVFVDRGRVSMSDRPSDLTGAQFIHSLVDQRSHRNLRALRALFQKHYPLRPLYFIGVTLSLLRYTAVYLMARSGRVLRIW